MILLDFQKKWVLDGSRKCIFEKSRQIGISWCEALWSVRRRLDKQINHYFISHTEDIANQFIKDCSEMCTLFAIDKYCTINKSSIIMPNGSEIVALSSSPKNVRGRRGDVSLDEYSSHDNQQELLAAAEPATTWGGNLRIISTHDGPNTEFYRLTQEAKEGKGKYSFHSVNIFQAVNEGFVDIFAEKMNNEELLAMSPEERKEVFIREKRESVSQPIWEQEYLCLVSASGSLLISPEVFDSIATISCVPDKLDKEKKYGRLFIGIDPGRKGAYSVIWVLEEYIEEQTKKTKYRTVCIREMTNYPLPEQMEIAKDICSHRNVAYVCCDMGAQGRSISEALILQLGNKTAEEVAITADCKASLCEKIATFAEHKRIEVPSSHTIRQDLTSMRRVSTSEDKKRYESYAESGHGDYFMALALAIRKIPESSKLKFAVGRTAE